LACGVRCAGAEKFLCACAGAACGFFPCAPTALISVTVSKCSIEFERELLELSNEPMNILGNGQALA
jgi:hypothetical protein